MVSQSRQTRVRQSTAALGLYHHGHAVAHSVNKAVEWYRKAAEQGYASAQSNLGICYSNGEGVTQDYGKAVEWYRKAAEQGHASAQYNLGGCFYNGQGVVQDSDQAIEWFQKAAEQGLTSLDLSGCKNLTNIAALSGIKGLTSLNLPGPITDEQLQWLRDPG